MWLTRFKFARLDNYETVHARLVNLDDECMSVWFGERAEIELTHRSTADSATNAATDALKYLAEFLLKWELLCRPVAVTTCRASASEPIPRLMGLAEAAKHLGVSTSRASQLAKNDQLPAPVAVLKMGPVYTSRSIEEFRRSRVAPARGSGGMR
jgi:hypothetical protein